MKTPPNKSRAATPVFRSGGAGESRAPPSGAADRRPTKLPSAQANRRLTSLGASFFAVPEGAREFSFFCSKAGGVRRRCGARAASRRARCEY